MLHFTSEGKHALQIPLKQWRSKRELEFSTSFLDELFPRQVSIVRSPGKAFSTFFPLEESLAITWKSFSLNLVPILL